MRALLLLFGALGCSAQVLSHVTVMDVKTGRERVVATLDAHFEAPNWTPDGKHLILNSKGGLYRLPVEGGVPEKIETGNLTRINNDHGVSKDGKWLVVSAGHMYVLPIAGGVPRQVTSKTPSYYHGWSPDGRTLVYCAKRDDNFDLFAIGVEGGEERRLTTHPGYDDGPDYTPDGKWIWFNSDRAGTWDLWRIPANGAGESDAKAERITSDAREDWFPHPSPNGKQIVYISFLPGTKGHPANQTIQLKWMDLKSRRTRVLKELFGGQGTMNVNSWAPDGRRFAFVRYELKP
jgi:Tol biopolymer transport system component